MKNIILTTTLLISTITKADLPLSLEGISPEAKHFKLGITLSYYNQNKDIYRQGISNYFMTPQNTLIEIPSPLTLGKQNTDMLYSSFSLQYGLNKDTEIYGNIGGFWQQHRYSENNHSISTQQSALSEVNLSLNHIVARDGNNPLLIGVIETSLMEKVGDKKRYGKSWFIGLDAHKAIDPIVFSLSTGYRFNIGKVDNHKIGHYFLIRPSVSFVANDRVSLNAKLQWLGKQGNTINNIKQPFETHTRASFGASYAFSQQTSLSLDAGWHLSGNDGSQITLAFQHRF